MQGESTGWLRLSCKGVCLTVPAHTQAGAEEHHPCMTCRLGSARAHVHHPCLFCGWACLTILSTSLSGLATKGNNHACLPLQVCVLNSVAYAEREEKQDWEQHLDNCILLTNTQVSHGLEHACQPGVAGSADSAQSNTWTSAVCCRMPGESASCNCTAW